MTEDAADHVLERVLQAALSLTQDREEALWQEFAARERPDTDAWIRFGEIMLQVAAGVRHSIQWSTWPARGVPGIG
jgi:hypothetical protein